MKTTEMNSNPSRRTAREIPVTRKLLYSVIIVLGILGFTEGSLRLLAIGRPPVIGQMRFGYDTGIPIYDSDGIEAEGDVFHDAPLFEQDGDLFWRPIANTPFTGPRGFRKPEPVAVEPSTNSLTIAVIGDSCSFLGQRPYPALLAELLLPSDPDSVLVYNASCPGYSSQQGVAQLAAIELLKPDVVIVYYGWNDHWNSLNGCSDRELIERTEFSRQAQSVLGDYSTYWLARSFFGGPSVPSKPTAVTVRVPLGDYEQNLQTMAKRFDEWNCKGVFVSAPTCFVQGELPAWAQQFFAQYYEMTQNQVESIPQTHDLYNEVVRKVASQFEHCQVCELDKVFQHEAKLFRSDCIHLSEFGHQQAAKEIAESIREFDLQQLNLASQPKSQEESNSN